MHSIMYYIDIQLGVLYIEGSPIVAAKTFQLYASY